MLTISSSQFPANWTAGEIEIFIAGLSLPPEATALEGTPCDPDACDCHVSPHLTCQVARVIEGWVPARIGNARKGDLILCPGDGSGTIGALLGALQTPQVYSHMGIAVDEGLSVRHCTMEVARLQAYPAGDAFGIQLPLNGFDPEKAKRGWPGTITQSVDEALEATSPAPLVPFPVQATPRYLYCDRDNGTTSFTSEKTSEFCFKVADLGFFPVFGALGGARREALVVQPCWAAEMANPLLRQVLHAIADEVKGIAGHYRYFAYTNGTVGTDATFAIPGAMPLFRWDDALGSWSPAEDTLFNPALPCLPAAEQPPVTSTVPAMCSSLIWTAVQRFNARQNKIRVILDSDDPQGDEPPTPAAGCVRLVTAPPGRDGDVPDPDRETADGQYFFTAADRANVAAAFHAGLEQQVLDTIASDWGDIVAAIESVEGVTLTSLFTLGFVFEAAEAAVWDALSLAGILKISEASAASLVQLLTAMPQHIANQIVNAFASDNAAGADETSNAWQNPGVGRSVGPDDIVWFWDAPLSISEVGGQTVIRGIYGQNRRLLLQQPGRGQVPQCVWTVSAGQGTLQGFVRQQGAPTTGPGVAGAVVTIACVQVMTNHDGFFTAVVPSGTYWATAFWQDPDTDDGWTAQEAVTVVFDSTTDHTFTLAPPPIDFREVNIQVFGDAVDTTISAKSWTSISSNGTILLGPRGGASHPELGSSGSWTDNGMTYSDTNAVGIEVDVGLEPHGFVSGKVKAVLLEDKDVQHSESMSFGPIAPGASVTLPSFSMSSGGWFPDKADVTVVIFNDQGYGPPGA